MNAIKIQGAEHPISDIFSDDFAFEIPPYQRPYAWTLKQATELFDDLMEFLGDTGEAIDRINPYFLGSIVLIKGDAPDAQIIDGQQRLTTLTILLAALRASLSNDLAKYFVPFLYQEGNKLKGTPDMYRLKLRNKDNDFFQRYIQSKDGILKLRDLNSTELPDSQLRIKENAILFLNELERIAEEKRFRLAQFIVNRCYIVVVATPDLDSAYRIFSVLNDRGLNLNNADIFKADVIGNVPDYDRQKYGEKWEDVEESLGRTEFDNLLSHVRSIFQKQRRGKNILDDLRSQIKQIDAKNFVDDFLIPYSGALYCINNFSYSNEDEDKAKQINQLFRWLNRLPHSDWIPPAILYLSKNRNKPESLIDFFKNLERLSIALWAQDVKDNLRIYRYSEVMRAIEEDNDLLSASSPLSLSAQERSNLISVLGGEIYHNTKLCRYILLRLDDQLSEGIATYDFPSVTIEHVLPQNPASKTEWSAWFTSRAQQDKYVHHLGNLVLLSKQKNKDAKNYSFAEKKEKYFSSKTGISPFVLTTQVLQEPKWTPNVVEKRQRELMTILEKLWRL